MPAVGHQDARVLLVDDDPAYLRLMAAVVADALPDATIVTAPDAWTARWERSRLEAPLLVISDQRMPGESGSDLLCSLAPDRRPGDCFALLTSFAGDETVRELVAAGIDDVLEKPVDLAGLEYIVGRVVQAWGARVDGAQLHV